MIEVVRAGTTKTFFCNTCAHEWRVASEPVGRFTSIEDLTRRTGLRRDELATLADIGALNAFTNERRSALWQVERAVRPAGELFAPDGDNSQLQIPTSNVSLYRTRLVNHAAHPVRHVPRARVGTAERDGHDGTTTRWQLRCECVGLGVRSES